MPGPFDHLPSAAGGSPFAHLPSIGDPDLRADVKELDEGGPENPATARSFHANSQQRMTTDPSVAFDQANLRQQRAAAARPDLTNAANAPQGGVGNFLHAAAAGAFQPLANLGSRLIHNNAITGYGSEDTNFFNPPTVENPQPQQPFEAARQRQEAATQQEIAEHGQLARDLAPYDPSRTSGRLGSLAGGVAPVLASGPAAPAMMVGTGFENRQEEIDARRAAGQTITPGQQLAYTGLGAGLDLAVGKLLPGQAASKAIMGELPAVANPLARLALNTAVGGAVSAPEMGLYHAGDNLARKVSGVNPDQAIGEGVPEASMQGLALGAAGQAVESIPHLRGGPRPTPSAPTPYDFPSGEVQGPLLREGGFLQPEAERPAPHPPEQAPEAYRTPGEIPAHDAESRQRENAALGLIAAKAGDPPQPRIEPEAVPAAPASSYELAEGTSPAPPPPSPLIPRDLTGRGYPAKGEETPLTPEEKEWAGIFHDEAPTQNKSVLQRIREKWAARRTTPRPDPYANPIKPAADTPVAPERPAALRSEAPRNVKRYAGEDETPNALASARPAQEVKSTPEPKPADAEEAHDIFAEQKHPEINMDDLIPLPEEEQPAARPSAEQKPSVFAQARQNQEAASAPVQHEPRQPIDDAIADAAMKLGEGQTDRRLKLADIRNELSGYSRQEQDAALLRSAKRGDFTLYGMDDPKEIKPADTAAAFTTPSGEPRHLMYFQGKLGEAAGEAKGNLLQRLAAGEEGGKTLDAAGKAFAERDVIPAARKAMGWAKDIATHFDKSENLGFTTTAEGKKAALGITKALADAKIAGRDFEAQIAPHLEHVPSFSKDRAGALHWADQVEANGNATSPQSQPIADAVMHMRKQNAAEAKNLGINLDEEGWGLSRMFKEPAGKKKGSASVTGPEGYLKKQKYDTFSDAYNAALKGGLEPAYDNPAMMQVARQYEVARSLGLRKQLRQADLAGSVEWHPEKTKLPEGHAKLDDSIADETRRLALPTWMVGRYAKMESFEGQKYLKEHAAQAMAIRPGEQPPQGYSFTGQESKGYYHAPEDTARMWNNAATRGGGDPLAKLPGQIARSLVMMRYDFSPVHAFNGLRQHANFLMGNAVSKLWGGAGKDQDVLGAMNIFGRRTNEVLREIQKPGSQSPDVQEIARRIQSYGADIKVPSVLDESRWKPAAEEFKAGNWQGGTLRTIDALRGMVKDGIYNQVLNRIAVAQMRGVAEAQMKGGTSEAAGQASGNQASEVVNRALGRHVDSPQFKNTVLKEVGKIVAPAYTYKTGLLRNIAEAARGNPHAQALVAGSLINTALSGAAIMAALTYANTGKVQMPESIRDYWNPRTGRKDENGHEERITTPGSEAFTARMTGLAGTKGFKDELIGSLNPAITGAAEVYANKDYYGNEITHEGDGLKNVGRAAAHIGRGMLPMSMTGQIGEATPEDGMGERVAREMGVNFSHPVTSEAEQHAYDILNKNQKAGRTPAQAELRENEKKWVGQIASGQGEQAKADMRSNPALTPGLQASVFRRARERQAGRTGLASLVSDTQFTPADLKGIWDRATPEEQQAIKQPLLERFSRAKPASREDAQAWRALRDVIGASK